MQNNKTKNIKVEYLKALAIILVVLGHSISYYESSIGIGILLSGFKILVYSIHVPLFFAIAGFLCHKQPICPYLSKKLYRILIPFYIFSFAKVAPEILAKIGKGDSADGFAVIFDLFIYGNEYWFCYCLFILYIIAIPLWSMKEKWYKWLFFGTIMINTLLFIYKIEITTVFQLSNVVFYIPYFILGMGIAKNKNILYSFVYKKSVLALVSVAALGLFILRNSGIEISLVKYSFSVCLMTLIWIIVTEITKKHYKENNCLLLISRYSYQIMLIDSFNKVILFKIIEATIGLHSEILIFVLAFTNLLLSLLLCAILKNVPVINFAIGLRSTHKIYLTEKS